MAHATVLPLATTVPQPIRVAIADSEPLVRAGLQALLEREADVAVIGHAGDGEEAAALTRDLRPEVLLVDSELPRLDGIALTRLIQADHELAGVRTLLLSASDTDERFLPALRAGISGFLLKDGRLDQLADAVRSVARGDAALAPGLARRLMAELAAQPDVSRHIPEQLEDLTARERQVVALVAGGLSNGEIAEQLVVSPSTAKTHVSHALCKLHVRDRAQLVRLAYETGLVVPRQPVSPTSGTPTLVAA
jgi:DNA-binding NarL/FixJ family response regulator